MRTETAIQFGYGLVAPWIERADDDVLVVSGPDAPRLSTPIGIRQRRPLRAGGVRRVPGRAGAFALRCFLAAYAAGLPDGPRISI
jgi:hypothetical protein